MDRSWARLSRMLWNSVCRPMSIGHRFAWLSRVSDATCRSLSLLPRSRGRRAGRHGNIKPDSSSPSFQAVRPVPARTGCTGYNPAQWTLPRFGCPFRRTRGIAPDEAAGRRASRIARHASSTPAAPRIPTVSPACRFGVTRDNDERRSPPALLGPENYLGWLFLSSRHIWHCL